MGAELVDVEDPQAGCEQRSRRGEQREVRVVLVINRVVLPPLDQAQEVGELQGQHPCFLHQRAQPFGEPADVWHVGEDVVRYDQVRPAVLRRDGGASIGAEELHHRRDAPDAGSFGHVGCRLNAEDGDPLSHEVLQEVTVIACRLGHQALGGEAEAFGNLLGEALGVRYPRVGV